MKSIDEAGVEWHLSHPDADKEETWKACANYVLDEIEKVVQGDLDSHSAFKLKTIKQIVEQLKK